MLKKIFTKIPFKFLLPLLLLAGSIHPLQAHMRVEFCYDGDNSLETARMLRDMISIHPDHIYSRISHHGRYYLGNFEENTSLTRDDIELVADAFGLTITCYFQSNDMENAGNEYMDYHSCLQAHRASGKTNSFNTCGTAMAVCDGDNINVAPWGAGTTITLWPDPPRNPDYDPFIPTHSPWVNPWGVGTNYGCLQAGELNTIWMRMTVSTAGNLEWSFDFPDIDYMDWSLFRWSPTICADIVANNVASAPVRCNWNDWPASPRGYTGMITNAVDIPVVGEEDNYEVSLAVVPGDEFLLLMDNWSGDTFIGTMDFSNSGSSAAVCGSVLPFDHTELTAIVDESGVQLNWINLGPQNYGTVEMEMSYDEENWTHLDNLSQTDFLETRTYLDYPEQAGTIYYRIKKQNEQGETQYSNVEAVNVTSIPDRITLSPNPGNGVMFNLTVRTDIESLMIYDLTGKLVWQEAYDGTTKGASFTISPGLPKGIFNVVAVQTNGKLVTSKLLVE